MQKCCRSYLNFFIFCPSCTVLTLHSFIEALKKMPSFFYFLNLQHFSIQGILSHFITGIMLMYSFETRFFFILPVRFLNLDGLLIQYILFSNKGETSVKVTFLVMLNLTLLYLGKYSTDLFLQKGFLFIIKETN